MASALDHLKVSHAVPHNSEVSEKLNALIALLETIQGRNGIKVTLTGRNILISLGAAAGAVAGSQGASGANGGDGTSDELHYNDGTISIDIDGSGIVLVNLASGCAVKMLPAGSLEVFNFATASTLFIDPALITHNMGIASLAVNNSGVPATIDLVASAPY